MLLKLAKAWIFLKWIIDFEYVYTIFEFRNGNRFAEKGAGEDWVSSFYCMWNTVRFIVIEIGQKYIQFQYYQQISIINLTQQQFQKIPQQSSRIMSKPPPKKARLNRNDEIDFLRDFDLLTSITPEEQTLYGQADITLGEKIMADTYVLRENNENKDGKEKLGENQGGSQQGNQGTLGMSQQIKVQACQQKYKLSCNIDQFKNFGTGIYLLFTFMKKLTIIFGIASILSLIALILLLTSNPPQSLYPSNQFKHILLQLTLHDITASKFPAFIGINYAIVVILAGALIFWSEQEKHYIIECLKVKPLASYSTVILKVIPQRYNQRELEIFVNGEFGEIREIYTVRNFGDDLLYYKDMTDITQAYKQEKALTALQPQRKCHQLSNLFFEFRNGHIKLKQKIRQSQNYKPVFAFIQFKKIEDREKLLSDSHKLSLLSFFSKSPSPPSPSSPSTLPYSLHQLQFQSCEMQPCGILWQNLHLTKKAQMVKSCTMILLMILVLVVSMVLIFLLSAVQMSVMNSKFRDFGREEVVKAGDRFALLTFCVNLSFSMFYANSDICAQFGSQYVKMTIMTIMIPLSISLFKLVLTQLMKSLATFRRYAYQIRKIQSQTMIIFVFYFLVTGVLQLVIYLGSENSSLFGIFEPLIRVVVNSDFSAAKISIWKDYEPNWYATASFNIFMIGAISFNLSALGIILYCFLRKKLFFYFAKKQKIQLHTNQWLKAYTLQIEYIYAALLTIIYFTLLFGGCMPILYVLAFASFLILFWSYKYVFINFCARPLVYNHSISKKVRKITFWAIVMHCVITPVFYMAPGIAGQNGVKDFFGRIFTLWYYPLLMFLILFYYCFQKPIRILFPIIKQRFSAHSSKKKSTQAWQAPLPQPQTHLSPSFLNPLSIPFPKRKQLALPTVVRKKHNDFNKQSYSMHENQGYKDILRTLYTINNKERARKTCVLNKDLLSLYLGGEKEEGDYRTLLEVIKIVRRDYKKYCTKHGRKSRNPYQKIKRKIYEIYEHSKKGQNHKYTVRLSNIHQGGEQNSGSGLGSGDSLEQEKREKQLQIQLDKLSSGTQTKDFFLDSNFKNLEKVVQADSVLEDEHFQNENKNKEQKDKKLMQIQKQDNEISFSKNRSKISKQNQYPEQSGKILNKSKL